MRKQNGVRTALAAAAVVLAGLPAMGQDSKPEPQPVPVRVKAPSSRGGLLGQRAALPNVLGRNRTLPIDRHITLPGLPVGTPMPQAPSPRPAVVGWPRVGSGGGLQVDGDYDGEKLDLHLHLGNGGTLIDDGRWYSPRGYSGRGYYYYNGRLYYSNGGYYRPGGYYYTPRHYYYSDEPVDGVLTERVDYTLRAPPDRAGAVGGGGSGAGTDGVGEGRAVHGGRRLGAGGEVLPRAPGRGPRGCVGDAGDGCGDGGGGSGGGRGVGGGTNGQERNYARFSRSWPRVARRRRRRPLGSPCWVPRV
jgi:hypothetical protein